MIESPPPLTMLLSRHTRRREFIALMASVTAIAWPRVPLSQQGTAPIIGFLSSRSELGAAEQLASLTRMPVFTVNKLSIGGIYDVPVADHLKLGVGGLVSKYALPSALKPFYGSDPTSFMVFLRLKLS
jgi:hypothetical protein